MNYQAHTFDNGLRLITVPTQGVESVTALVMVGAGSRYEDKKVSGISHFLEHMAFKGTKKRPTAFDISSTIDGIGGEANAFTSKDHTGYYIKSATKHLSLIVDVLSDILLNSKLEQMEIDKEKGVIIEEINMYEDLPMRRVTEIFEYLLYGDTPLGRYIAGEKQVIRSLKRDDFVQYMNSLYTPENAVVVIAGGIDEKQKTNNKKQITKLQELVGEKFGGWKKKKAEDFPKAPDKQKEPAVMLQYKKTDQAHLCVGVRAYKLSHPSRYALGVLTALLGGGMSSRLFIEVREKRGLAYYVRAVNERYQDVGSFVAHAGVDMNRIEDAIKVILNEYKRISEDRVKEKELQKAKEYLKGRLILSLEDSKTLASLFASEELLEGKIRTPKTIIENIDKVTADEVKNVAKDIFRTETLNLAVVGQYKDEERFRKLLEI